MNRFRMLGLSLWLCVMPFHLAAAEPLALATGEFPPYSGATLPGYGISSQIVQLALREAGHDSVVVFLPWRRAAAMTAKGHYAGSYPWAKNAEREQLFLYSQPLHDDRIRFFARLDSELDLAENWQGRILCIPAGWDASQVQAQIDRYQLRLERPNDMDNCFRMLAAGRLDLTVLNEQVAQSMLQRLGDDQPAIVPVGAEVARDRTYFIVSRDYPQAEQLIAAFNNGLARLKADGRYARLLGKAAQP